MPSSDILTIESLIAQAHRRLWLAGRHAEVLTDQGLADDLLELCVELERLQEDLVRGSRRPKKSPKGRA